MLDCSTNIPQLEGKRLMLDYNIVVDTLAVKCSKKGFFIASGREQGLTIFCRRAEGPQRRIISGKLSGMENGLDAFGLTCDERGHLFVCDFDKGNRCVQMFSLPDGEYLGCLIREGEQGLGTPESDQSP